MSNLSALFEAELLKLSCSPARNHICAPLSSFQDIFPWHSAAKNQAVASFTRPCSLAENRLCRHCRHNWAGLTPDLVFRDPYVLDFFSLRDTFSQSSSIF